MKIHRTAPEKSGLTVQVGWSGLTVGGCLALNLHLSFERSELLNPYVHDDSKINTAIDISLLLLLL